jgi:GT2 family glycosyltransferase
MTGANPELSILMVNWNTREMTLACLRSVYAQTHDTPFELIMVDNGSADGSAEAIAAAFPQVRLIAEAVNHGFAKANNIAAEQARGEYLLLLNTDTVVLDGAIDKLVAFARAHPDAGIWGGRTQFADGRLNPTSVWGKITPWSAVSFASGLRGLLRRFEAFNPEGLGAWQRDSERRVDIVSGCFLMIERAFWNRLGGFDRRFFMYGEEADLCARARAAGARPLMTPSACIIHYGGASATSHASKIAYVMGARIGLIERQYAGLGRVVGKSASLAHVAVRAFSFRLLGALFPARYAAKAREWGSAWARRAEWRNGPSAVEL